jgi:putative acetyltransferase
VSPSIERVEAPTDEIRMLIGELDAELSGPYAADQRHGLSMARLFQPDIAFFIARLDGAAVGCGGIAIGADFAEVKRMYVRPPARGRGVAQAILARLEEEGRFRGVTRLALETGDAQAAAMRFYERCGFSRCGAFGAYATMSPRQIERSVFFGKRILG